MVTGVEAIGDGSSPLSIQCPSVTKTTTNLKKYEFDPFFILPWRAFQTPPDHKKSEPNPSIMLWLVPAVVVVVVVMVCVFDHTIGTWSSFHPVGDIERALSVVHPSNTSTTFPLIRDGLSLLLLFLLSLTFYITDLQWRLFKKCVPGLIENGALVPRSEARLPKRRLIATFVKAGGSREYTLETLIDRLNSMLRSKAMIFVHIATLALSWFLAIELAKRERAVGVFGIFDPHPTAGQSVQAFSTEAYDHWWASQSHPIGRWVYIAIIALGIAIVFYQNIIGLFAIVIAYTIETFCDTSVDWFNKDLSYGWRPLGEVFRSVRWSFGIHGLALLIIVLVMGIQNGQWDDLLCVLWLISLPIYLGIPWRVFRRVRLKVQGDALCSLEDHEMENTKTQGGKDDPEFLISASRVVPYVRDAHINPLSLSRYGEYAFFPTIALPTMICVIEIMTR